MNELAIRILDPEEGQFLRRIEWNAEEFEGWMNELSAQYAETAIITPEDFKAAKRDRAELNKLVKAISARRIEVKKAVMEPYTAFEKELEVATEAVNKIADEIDRSIKEYEASERERKKAGIRKIFEDEVANPFYEQIPASEMEFLEFERVFDPKWLNASVKMATAEKELNEKLIRVEDGIRAILDMDTDPGLRAAAMQEFKRTLDLGAALRLHGDLAAKARREKEEQRRREEAEAEKRRQEDMEKLRARLGEEQAKPAAPPEPDGRAGAPESAFTERGWGNPQEGTQDAAQGQDGGRFGPSGAADNGSRYAGNGSPADQGGPQVPHGWTGTPPAAANAQHAAAEMQQPRQKTYFVEFRVEGTKEELMALREYMNRNGLRYGPVQKN